MIKDKTFLSSDKTMYAQALKLSKVKNKHIMLKLTADNCKYCAKMDNEVFTDNEVNTFVAKHFIQVTINVDKEEIPLGIKRTITPTFVFINKEGKIVSTLPGSWNKKDFIDLLRNRI